MKPSKQNQKPTRTTEHHLTVGGRHLIATIVHRDPPDLESFVDALIAMTAEQDSKPETKGSRG